MSTTAASPRLDYLSPLRYPGGKSWLVPEALAWLGPRPAVLLEPFAGGASVGLAAASAGWTVRLVEKSPGVAAFWRCVLTAPEWLAATIEPLHSAADLTAAWKSAGPPDGPEALRLLIQNRLAYGGIMAPGAGTMHYGERGRGTLSRWYPATLARRIRRIGAFADRLTCVEGCAIAALRAAQGTGIAVFLDPPYHAAGSRLYAESVVDYALLLRTAREVGGPILATYGDCPEARALLDATGMTYRSIQRTGRSGHVKRELIAVNG